MSDISYKLFGKFTPALYSLELLMIVIEILQKTYRIIRNRSDTVTRSKAIITKTKQITQNSGKLIAEVRADGIHLDDFPKLKEGGGQLRNETENLVNEVGAIGEKIKEETHQIGGGNGGNTLV